MRIGKLEIIIRWDNNNPNTIIKKILIDLKKNKFGGYWKIEAITRFRAHMAKIDKRYGLRETKELIETINYKYKIFTDEYYENLMRNK